MDARPSQPELSGSGTDLLDFILEDVQLLKQSLTEPRSFAVIMAGMNAAT